MIIEKHVRPVDTWPKGQTCFHKILLPSYTSYYKFEEMMDEALLNGNYMDNE